MESSYCTAGSKASGCKELEAGNSVELGCCFEYRGTKCLAAPLGKVLYFQSVFAKPVCCFVSITNSPKSAVSAPGETLVDGFHTGIQGG